MQLSPDIDTAVQALVRMLWLFPHYRVDSRHNIGCIHDALEALSPGIVEMISEKGAGHVHEVFLGGEED